MIQAQSHELQTVDTRRSSRGFSAVLLQYDLYNCWRTGSDPSIAGRPTSAGSSMSFRLLWKQSVPRVGKTITTGRHISNCLVVCEPTPDTPNSTQCCGAVGFLRVHAEEDVNCYWCCDFFIREQNAQNRVPTESSMASDRNGG